MAVSPRGLKFGTLVIVLQVVFIVLIAVFGNYRELEDSSAVGINYPNFQDVNVMIFIGFGFLMTFLKSYSFSAVGVNMLLAVMSIQWAAIVRGFIHEIVQGESKFHLGVVEMVGCNFAAATVLISFGALLGKTSPVQLLVMSLVEILLAQVNEYIGIDLLHVTDIGESMFIHMFGAYFGLAVARVLASDEVERSTKEGSVYHSDLFAMLGTVFLWIYWPTFNGGFAGVYQETAYINTFFALCTCTAVTFALSALLDGQGRFNMVHIQNSTLAGGVAIGATANMPMKPFMAMLFGAVAAINSVLGFKFMSAKLSRKLNIHDTCGVHNLHGVPGIIAATGAAVQAAMSADWPGDIQQNIFPKTAGDDGRSELEQGGYQLLAAVITFAIAIIGGTVTGYILKLPIWNAPRDVSLFDDGENWEVPEEDVPERPNTYKVTTSLDSPM